MKERFAGLASFLFIILFWFLYIFGIFHAFKKHNDNWVLNITPFALYRGVEAFYHDDYASVNWSARVYNETQNAFYLINDYITSDNPDTVGLKLEEFANRIHKYPSPHREKILSSVNLIVNYYDSLFLSFQGRISDISNGLITDTIPVWYKSAIPFYDSLYHFYDINEVERIRLIADSNIRFYLYSAAIGDYDKLKYVSLNVKLNSKELLSKCKKAHKILSLK